MTHGIDTVFIDAILVRLLRELGLPETFSLIKLSPRMQEWIVGQAEALQRDAMAHSTVAVLVKYGLPLTRENYLNLNNVDEDDLDAEQEGELPQLFQQSMVEERVASVMFEIEIDDTLRRLSATAVCGCTMTLDVAVVIAQPLVLAKLGHKSLQIVVPCKDCKNPTTEGYERME